jgi:hypothetical protein
MQTLPDIFSWVEIIGIQGSTVASKEAPTYCNMIIVNQWMNEKAERISPRDTYFWIRKKGGEPLAVDAHTVPDDLVICER